MHFKVGAVLFLKLQRLISCVTQDFRLSGGEGDGFVCLLTKDEELRSAKAVGEDFLGSGGIFATAVITPRARKPRATTFGAFSVTALTLFLSLTSRAGKAFAACDTLLNSADRKNSAHCGWSKGWTAYGRKLLGDEQMLDDALHESNHQQPVNELKVDAQLYLSRVYLRSWRRSRLLELSFTFSHKSQRFLHRSTHYCRD